MTQFLPLDVAFGSAVLLPSPGGGTPDPDPPTDPGTGTPATVLPYPFLFAEAVRQESWERNQWGRTARADMLRRISTTPTGLWIGGWSGGTTGNFTTEVNKVRGLVQPAAALSSPSTLYRPLLIIYGAPFRDAGGASAGGFPDNASYAAWITAIARDGIGGAPCDVIVEPDGAATSLSTTVDQPSSPPDERSPQLRRYKALRDACNIIADVCPKARLYLDAGNAGWKSAATMIPRIQASGVPLRRIHGISANVSNYRTTTSESNFCEAIIAGLLSSDATLTHLRYIIDVSRNGNGPGTTQFDPTGRALGPPPSYAPDPSGRPLCEARLWVKWAGSSDVPFSGTTMPRTVQSGSSLTQVYSGKTGDFYMDRAVEMATNRGY